MSVIERAIVFLLSSVFLVLMVNNLIGVLVAWRLVKIVRGVDPGKHRELTAQSSVFGRLFWVNPRKLTAFVKAGDSLGSPAIAAKLSAYRRVTKIARVCLLIHIIGLLTLFIMMK